MSEFNRTELCRGVSFTGIIDDRFKRNRIGVALITPLDKKTAAANALLSCVLTRSCKKYPDFTSFSRKLDSLYSAAIYPLVRKIGDYQAVVISVSGIEDKYAYDGQSVSEQLSELLCSVLFEPNLTDGRFNEEDVEQERRQLLEDIDAEFNEKRTYAINRCIENMCQGEPFSIGRCGSREDVESLSSDDIYNAWKNLIDNSRVEITMLGSTDPEKSIEKFRSFFKPRTCELPSDSITKTAGEEVRRITETDELSQSKLVMGFRCKKPGGSKESVENTLMGIILGGIPTSKLFLNVREKQSLCYYCAARVDNEKGILLIDSGVESENIEKTEAAVLRQIEEMKKGNITEEELHFAKLALKNAFISSTDSLAALQSFYISRANMKEKLSPREASALVDDITSEKITMLARQIELDTVYTLKGQTEAE